MSRPWRLTAPVPSESDVVKGCKTILQLHHYWLIRCHAGVFESLDHRRKIRGVDKGHPDWACLHAFYRNFLLEVKRPGGVLSPDQIDKIAFLEREYRLPIVVVETVDELCNFLAKHERPHVIEERKIQWPNEPLKMEEPL